MASALNALAAPPLLFFLPGALFLRLVAGRGRGPLPRDFREWLFLSALGSVLPASWIGLALAELSLFSLRAVLAAQALLSLGLLLAAPRASWGVPRPRAAGLAWAAVFACLAAAFFAPPYEYVLGNWDPGTYVNTGARLARCGSISYRDPVLAALSPEERTLFYYTHLVTQRYEGGMAIGDHLGAVVSPHFYHVYTVWLALFDSLGGLGLSLWVNPLLGLLALAAFALAARELAGGRTASLAALFLACSAAEVWCVRFSTAEVAAQLFFWSGLFCLFRLLDEDRGAWGLLAGACFAAALLTVYTGALVLPALFVLLLAWDWGRPRGGGLLFFAALAAGLVHLVLQDLTVCRHYIERQLEVFRSQGLNAPRLAAAAAAFLLAAGSARLLLRGTRERAGRLAASPAFRILLGAVLAGSALYAYALRPLLGGGPDARTLRELGWFVYPFALGAWYFPAGLVLALLGALMFVREGLDRKRGAFLLIALPVCAFLVLRKLIFPSYLWAIRRFIPLAFPALILLMAYPLARLAARGRAWRAAAAAAAIALLACMQHGYTRHVMPVDYAGTVEFLGRLGPRLDPGGIFVCEGSGMAAPLDCVYGLDILQLSAQTPEKCRAVERVMEGWLKGGRRVWYLSRGGWPLSPALLFTPAGSVPLLTDHLEYRVGSFPTRRIPVEAVARVFRVGPLGPAPEAGVPRRVIDIGEDAFPLLRGFYGPVMRREREGGRPSKRWARWTAGEAALVIPTFGSRRDLAVTMRAAVGKDRPGVSVRVEVSVEGKPVVGVTVPPLMGDCRFVIPAAALPPARARASLEIRSPVHRAPPQEFSPPQDIGICIDRVEVAPVPRG